MSSQRLAALSFRAAKRCENATTARCVCRCHGAFHGTRRLATDAAREEYERLDTADPHRVEPKRWR